MGDLFEKNRKIFSFNFFETLFVDVFKDIEKPSENSGLRSDMSSLFCGSSSIVSQLTESGCLFLFAQFESLNLLSLIKIIDPQRQLHEKIN